jgi:hypothetical protein
VGAIPLLIDTIAILLFFFMIFAIAGLQLWMGLLQNRCMIEASGFVLDIEEVCGYRECDDGNL